MTRIFLLVVWVLTSGLVAGTAFSARAAERSATNPRNPNGLTILGPNYPRVFFFRAAEGVASRAAVGYEQWDAEFSRLMGIMGKCLDEEVLGREQRNPEFFSRFKRNHSQQVVLLHLNGNSRDPRYHTERYSAGHWGPRRAGLQGPNRPLQDVAGRHWFVRHHGRGQARLELLRTGATDGRRPADEHDPGKTRLLRDQTAGIPGGPIASGRAHGGRPLGPE